MDVSFHDAESVTLELDEEGEIIELYTDGLFVSAVQLQQEWYTKHTEGIFAIIPRNAEDLPLFLQNCLDRPCLSIHLPPNYEIFPKKELIDDISKQLQKKSSKPLLSQRNSTNALWLCRNCFAYDMHGGDMPCASCMDIISKPYFWGKSCGNCIHADSSSLCSTSCNYDTEWENWELDECTVQQHLDWLKEEYTNDIDN